MANIGKELEEIEVVPLPAPVEPDAPAEQPSIPAQPDREPVPTGLWTLRGLPSVV